MNNTFSLEQKSKTRSRDSKLRLPLYELDLMATFMEIKSMFLKLKENEITKDLGYSTSSLRRNRRDINMLSPYRIPPSSYRRKQETLIENLNLSQMTSKDVN